MMSSSACWLSPDREVVTSRAVPVCLIEDSDAVRRLIEQQDAIAAKDREEVRRFFDELGRLYRRSDPAALAELRELSAHPEKFIPERIVFLNAIHSAKCTEVPESSYGRVLERSEAICSSHPQENPRLMKIAITTGSSKGVVGWGCLGDGLAYSVTMP